MEPGTGIRTRRMGMRGYGEHPQHEIWRVGASGVWLETPTPASLTRENGSPGGGCSVATAGLEKTPEPNSTPRGQFQHSGDVTRDGPRCVPSSLTPVGDFAYR